MSEPANKRSDFLYPRFWLTWFFLGLLRLLILLPLRWIEKLGSALGMLMFYALPSRREVAATNIGIAYPDLDNEQIDVMVRQSFKNVGIGTFEIAMAWWQQPRLLQHAVIHGLEHIQNALAQGKGVILLTSHFTSLEPGGHILCTHIPLEAVYKPAHNKLFEYFMVQNRKNHLADLISNDSPRKMIAALKNNHAIWYAPDQNLGGKDLVFAPFFNEQATAITAPSRLAKLSGAPLIPYYVKRSHAPETGRVQYELFILPAVEDFPTDDIEHDAARVNQINEQLIRFNPEQYLWVHKRYKTRPPGSDAIY